MNREEIAKELEQIANKLRRFSYFLEGEKKILESSELIDCVVANLLEAISKDELYELSRDGEAEAMASGVSLSDYYLDDEY